MKKASIIIITTIILGTLIFLGIRFFGNKKAKIILVDYKQYQTIKQNNDTFIIIFSMSKNKSTETLEYEISQTLKNKKTKVYELDLDEIDKSYYSKLLDEINDIKQKESDTINIPTIAIYKDSRIVYVHEGFIDNKEFNNTMNEYNIK